jgi:coenzyme F420-0:L-glutamate ligase
MIVTPIHIDTVQAHTISLTDLLDSALSHIDEGSILAITSKVVSLCEGRVASLESTTREALIAAESSYYVPAELSKYGHHFTITNNTLIASAGIDVSNAGGGYYVLWPADPQKTANEIRAHVRERFGLKDFGVIITDSTSQPFRLGTTGICLASSGFKSINSYIGKPDLFGQPLHVNRANMAGGLAAAAVVMMGEGSEGTPLCLLRDLQLVDFQDTDPTPEELAAQRTTLETDLFEPFLRTVPWQRGEKS